MNSMNFRLGLKRKSIRYRKKSLVILAIICISSSTLYKICLIGENFYKKNYLIPEVEEFERKNVRRSIPTKLSPLSLNSSLKYVNNILTASRIRHQLKQDNTPTKCSDEECSDFLNPTQLDNFNLCTTNARKLGKIETANCSFLNGSREPIGLSSFPGSGNTWIRGLLQKVTGYCTGSLYCDSELRRQGFPGEAVSSGNVLVTKMHGTESQCTDNCFKRVIFIIRDPFRAIISEWNRERTLFGKHKVVSNVLASHIASVGQENFGDDPEWVKFVQSSSKHWMSMITYWLITWSLSHQLHVVEYDNLIDNKSGEISKMLRFMGIHVEEENVRDKLGDGFRRFHRQSRGNFTHFTAHQLSMINSYLVETQKQLTSLRLDVKFNLSLERYLKTDVI